MEARRVEIQRMKKSAQRKTAEAVGISEDDWDGTVESILDAEFPSGAPATLSRAMPITEPALQRRNSVNSDSESDFQDATGWEEEREPPDAPTRVPALQLSIIAPSTAAPSEADDVRRRATVDRALGQLFELTDSLSSARMLFSRYDREPRNGELDVRALRAMLQHLGHGQWEYSKADARNVLAVLAPGRDSLSFGAFQREVKLGLLEALRRRWLAQSFSAQQEGQDWTRLWVLFTKHRAGADRSGNGPAERLTFAQFEAAARKAGFGAHRGQNLKRTARSSVCGMAANLSDAELKSMFALLVEVVQGTQTQRSLTDDGAATPTRRGLTFEGFLQFMERGCLADTSQASPQSSGGVGAGGECPSPAARAARWAHTPRELHPHADRVFDKLLKLKSASLRGAILPPDCLADPAKTVPRLSPKEFARRIGVVGVELSEEECQLLVAEFSTHNLVGGNEHTINVADFLARCTAYRRQHHSHQTHQRNVLRQGLSPGQPTTPTSASSVGATAATRWGANPAAGSRFFSSSSDEGADADWSSYGVAEMGSPGSGKPAVRQGDDGWNSSISGVVRERALAEPTSEAAGEELEPKHEREPEPEPEPELEPSSAHVSSPVDLYVEPQRPWSPPGTAAGVNPQDRASSPPPSQRIGRPGAVTPPRFTSHTFSSSQKPRQAQLQPSAASATDRDVVPTSTSDSRPAREGHPSPSPSAVYREQAMRLRKELAAMRAERDEALFTLAQQELVAAPLYDADELIASDTGQQQQQRRRQQQQQQRSMEQHKRLRKEMAALRADLSATKYALEESKAEVHYLRAHAAKISKLDSAAGGPSDAHSQDSWTESEIALFRWYKDDDDSGGTEEPARTTQLQHGSQVAPASAAQQIRAAMSTPGKVPFSRKRSEFRSSDPHDDAPVLQGKQWVEGLRASTAGAQSKHKHKHKHKNETQGGQDEEEHDQALDDWAANVLTGVPGAAAQEPPPPLSSRGGEAAAAAGGEEEEFVSDTETDSSDNTSIESDSNDDTASIISSSIAAGGGGLLLDFVPRNGMLLRAMCSVTVRSGFDLASRHIGDLEAGDAIEALEVRRNEATGQYRVRIAVAVHEGAGSTSNDGGRAAQPPSVDGWVNMATSEGTQALFSRVVS
jgi:hypothetical protein